MGRGHDAVCGVDDEVHLVSGHSVGLGHEGVHVNIKHIQVVNVGLVDVLGDLLKHVEGKLHLLLRHGVDLLEEGGNPGGVVELHRLLGCEGGAAQWALWLDALAEAGDVNGVPTAVQLHPLPGLVHGLQATAAVLPCLHEGKVNITDVLAVVGVAHIVVARVASGSLVTALAVFGDLGC